MADSAAQVGDVLVLTYGRLPAAAAQRIKDQLAEKGISDVVILSECTSAVVVKRASDG